MNLGMQTPVTTGSDADAKIAVAVTTESDLLRQELEERKARNLQLSADFENFKRRIRQEAGEQALAQKDSFIHELLPAIDNLERALNSGSSTGSPQLREGVEMTLQQLCLLLRQHGIEAEDCLGQPFDPRRHEAVIQHPDSSQPDHTILEVFHRGYRRGKQVFRPAKVVVNDLASAKPARHAT